MAKIPVKQTVFPFSGDWLSMRFTTSRGAVIYRVFFQFLASSTLSHIPTGFFNLLSSFSAPFYFLCVFFPGTFGRESSLAWNLSKAPSFLLVIIPPLEAQLAFLHSGTPQK